MKLFETAYQHKFRYYERYYDTDLKKSVVKPIFTPAEWYTEHPQGPYSYILDDNIKLKRQEGHAKDGRGHYGFTNPLYRHIRDQYWSETEGKYNKEPRTWYIDIETRVGKSYKNPNKSNTLMVIRSKKDKSEITSSIRELQDRFYENGSENYEYFDNISQSYEPLDKSIYFERNVGFPKPDKALEEICLMQVFDSKLNTVFVFGSRPWYYQDSYDFEYDVKYIHCKDEIDIIEKYLTVFKKVDPLLIYAWNGSGFDFPYIFNRLKNNNIDTNRLSNHGSTNLRYIEHIDSFDLQADGHIYYDLLDVYKKFTYGDQASYSLDYTAELLLGKHKVQHTEYKVFDDFYSGNYTIPEYPTEEQKNSKIYKAALKGDIEEVKKLAYSDFVYYGVIDTHLIKEIDNLKNFSVLLTMIAEKMGVLLQDSMGTVRPWARYISNKALQSNRIMPKDQYSDGDTSIKGGYVAEPVKGKHNWVLSSDVNSMYPLLGMVGFNMSPETFIPLSKTPNDLKEIILRYYNNENEAERFDIPVQVKERVTELLQKYNYSMGMNGALFTREKTGMIPEMIQDIYKSRKIAKKTMFAYEQKSVDIKEILHQRRLKLSKNTI